MAQGHHQAQSVAAHEMPDPWHAHSPAEGRPQHEHGSKIDPVALAVTFGLIVVTVLALTGGLFVYFKHYVGLEQQKKIETTVWAREYAQERAQAQARLEAYRWVDHERVGLPLSQAIDRVIADYGAQEGQRSDAR